MAGGTLSGDFEGYYDKASAIPQQTDAQEVARFADLLPAGKPLRVLDLGCAEGRLATELARRGHRVTAADISRSQLEKAAESGRLAGVSLATAKCDIEAGPGELAGREFDAVYLMDVIEHFRNPVAALENLRPLLAEDGLLFIHTPNVFAPARLAYYLLRPKKLVDYRKAGMLWDFHFQTYDYMSLEKTLDFTGFQGIRAVSTLTTVPYLFRSRRLAKWFPFLADTLLLVCRKAPPIDVDRLLGQWEAQAGAAKVNPGP
jgi:SAM-dependent methyltransferase